MKRLALILLLCAPLLAKADHAALEDFFGIYIGVGEILDAEGNVEEERDLDITIAPVKRHGFRVHWITVEKVDGRRDVPGVKRRVLESVFALDNNGIWTENTRGSLFSKAKKRDAMTGDAYLWARIEGKTLSVFTFSVLEDGGYTLTVYDRVLTDTGLDILFHRYTNDKRVRTVRGRAVKVE